VMKKKPSEWMVWSDYLKINRAAVYYF